MVLTGNDLPIHLGNLVGDMLEDELLLSLWIACLPPPHHRRGSPYLPFKQLTTAQNFLGA